MGILDLLKLNEPQARAVAAGGRLVVTAGAGSGKTRTLVGRYLGLLEAGLPLRSIVAITFTDKAAREMRNRIRRTVTDWLAQNPPRRDLWESVFAELDAARIGTIHSLCAQILRTHPVEAARLESRIAPGFGVLEEGRAAVLRARAVEDALAWAAADEQAAHLFRALTEFGLRAAVSTLLEKHLDAGPAFEKLGDDPLQGWAEALDSWLGEQLDAPEWLALLSELAGLHADDPADKMEIARQAVLACAEEVGAARARRDFGAALTHLAELHRSTSLQGRKGNWPGESLETAKDIMRGLRAHFEQRLQALADPKKPAAWEMDEQAAGLIWPLHATYRKAIELYNQAKQSERALDFDDLEAGALALLRDDDRAVRAAWQAEVRAVLVDEFQDTNERQRQIVYALAGFEPVQDRPDAPAARASLFIVGDSKQSIYRFRGADVTVFRRVQDDVARAGGQVIPLDLTFRAHRALVETTNRLLAPVLGETERPGRPYEVPFAPLAAFRSAPRPGIAEPFIEWLLGMGEPADEGRRAAAEGLAARLLELHAQEGVEWQDVALLFRASTSFPVYEDALERAGIPFVTVAGRGFYERPEVRDLLNALMAAADPTDDLALVGFLRSPAIGLSDAALYLLRFPPGDALPVTAPYPKPRSIWSVLNHPALADIAPPDDLPRALHGRELLEELHTMAGRVPAAALLKHLLDKTHYRAGLQTFENGARAQRNVDKLLADAHASGLVSVREFVEYAQTLRDAGARESEAPTEAGRAVQLMTVHKAKGLEFPVVVIADAAHAGRGRPAEILVDDLLGVTMDLRDPDRPPAAHRLAALRDAERAEAEDRRLLYVAATRAQEKLIISAHSRVLKGGQLSLAGWLKRLGEVVGLDELTIAGTPVEAQRIELAPDMACTLYPSGVEREALGVEYEKGASHMAATAYSSDLIAPLVGQGLAGADAKLVAREAEPPQRVWRVVPRGKRPQAPAWVIGTLTHTALRAEAERLADAELETFLRPFTLEMGVVDEAETHASIREAVRMLRRFQAHPLWAELNAAQRWHEVPFSLVEDGQVHNGIIDLLYRTGDTYRIVEFKTDELKARANLATHIQKQGYDEQVRRYVRAVRSQLGVEAQAALVFLNAGGRVLVSPVTSPA